MNKILWNHSECAYCGKNIEEQEELEASILVEIRGVCPHCGTKNFDDDWTYRICSHCYVITCGMEDESDEFLIEMGVLKPGETKAGKTKELELAFEKRTGRKAKLGV